MATTEEQIAADLAAGLIRERDIDIVRARAERRDSYEHFSMQLDKLWHDVDGGKFGNDAKTGSWYLSVKEVKDRIEVPAPLGE